jgi:succinate-semialdehyde dehydrogenase / glutarate-semialdehyde dehydrogenase
MIASGAGTTTFYTSYSSRKIDQTMAYKSINPFTGEITKSFDDISDKQLEVALSNAQACFEKWRHFSYQEREVILTKVAILMWENAQKLAELMTLEMGKRIQEARGEVEYSANILDYYAEHAATFLKPVELKPSFGSAYMESNPLGVIFCVEPWNFPFYQLARVAGPHLMAGNTILVKHAGNVPQCALAFEALWAEAGAPPGLYTNVFISYDQADIVVDDNRIKGVALTGSVEAGRILAARAGQNLKPSTMELGGSDAFIVLEDADLEEAIKWAVWGRMYNDGQTCCAAKRFIVVETVAETFLQRFTAAILELKAGDPLDATTTLGPLSSEGALVQLLKQIQIAVANGATLVTGGKRINRPGWFLEPTILIDVAKSNPAFRDEFFGPVAMFFTVKDEEEAIALANDSDFGLGGSVYTKDVERGRRIASRIEAGMIFINNISWSDAELPFGGIKNSGYGRELGDMGIHAFVNKKLVRYADMKAPG